MTEYKRKIIGATLDSESWWLLTVTVAHETEMTWTTKALIIIYFRVGSRLTGCIGGYSFFTDSIAEIEREVCLGMFWVITATVDHSNKLLGLAFLTANKGKKSYFFLFSFLLGYSLYTYTRWFNIELLPINLWKLWKIILISSVTSITTAK